MTEQLNPVGVILADMADITAPTDINIEVQTRPQFGKNNRVLYVHVNGQTVLRICRIPDSINLTVHEH